MTEQQEQTKYDLVLNNIEDDLLHTRWNVKSLEEHLKNTYNITGLCDIDKSGLISDYAFIVPINPTWGYVDIYYLTIPYDITGTNETLMITEVSVCEE